MTPRVCSTKTRIKTHPHDVFWWRWCNLREYVPLKQGLRQGILKVIISNMGLREYVPLKQGLRPRMKDSSNFHQCKLREYVPLKQGLRRIGYLPCHEIHGLREYVPLKQGLRLLHIYSTKWTYLLREYVPLKQGLRRAKTAVLGLSFISESMFH